MARAQGGHEEAEESEEAAGRTLSRERAREGWDPPTPPPKGGVEKGGKGSTIKTPRKHSSGKQETPGWGNC